ncbi:MAG: hypothetical protein IT270_03345 [Saprospiraceae bacterium]|nr:hypothetical protein [Saprospiraceae bacterium]
MLRLSSFVVLLAALFAACQSETPTDKPSQTAQKQMDAGIDTLTGAPKKQPNPWFDKGCDLVTTAEVQQLFGIEPKRDVFNERTLKGQTFCLRSWMKPNWKEIENANEKPGAAYQEFKNSLIINMLDYGTETVAKEQLDMARRTRKDLYEKEINDLGDGALWSSSSNTLMVKKGHLFISITLDYAGTPEGNLSKARDVANLALKKM